MYEELIRRLREEPLNSNKAALPIMDLCIDAATAIENLSHRLDMAISALRQQEAVTNRNGLNEPLTLAELRQMDGEPVWVQSPGIPEYGRWAIVEGAGGNCLFLHDDFTCHDYGKTWLAYRQKPEEGTD